MNIDYINHTVDGKHICHHDRNTLLKAFTLACKEREAIDPGHTQAFLTVVLAAMSSMTRVNPKERP